MLGPKKMLGQILEGDTKKKTKKKHLGPNISERKKSPMTLWQKCLESEVLVLVKGIVVGWDWSSELRKKSLGIRSFFRSFHTPIGPGERKVHFCCVSFP